MKFYGISLILIQGRISLVTFRRWQWLSSLISELLSKFELCLAQSKADGKRLSLLGASNVKSEGNLKLATAPLPINQTLLSEFCHEVGSRPAWLAASTHDLEEQIVWQVHKKVEREVPSLLTIIVPRHSERGRQISEELARLGAKVARRSQNDPIENDTNIYIADTTGELGLFYRFVDIVFIGKSFVNLGGQNLIEPAQLKNAILHGPFMWNFEQVVKELRENSAAITVKDGNELAKELQKLFLDSLYRENFINAAYNFSETQAHVIENVFSKLKPFFKHVEEEEYTSETPRILEAKE